MKQSNHNLMYFAIEDDILGNNVAVVIFECDNVKG